MKTIKIQCCLWLFISIHLSMAANWYVDPAGSADPNGSIENPFPVIQNALDEAQSGDTIILKPGVYTGPGNYNLNPDGLALTIQSTDPTDPDIRTETIMDPNQAGRAFLFTSGEDLQCIIDGLTIRNALASDSFPFGGAVYKDHSGDCDFMFNDYWSWSDGGPRVNPKWRFVTAIKSKSDRFGNTLQYEWNEDTSNPVITKVSGLPSKS